MYFKDLYEEINSYNDTIKVKIGWLDEGQPYTKGDAPQEFIDKLKSIQPHIRTKGWHDCPFCKEQNKYTRSSNQYLIKVPDRGYKVMYDVPEMIFHYMEVHNYLPPQEFIDAVMNFELDESDKYENRPMRNRFNNSHRQNFK